MKTSKIALDFYKTFNLYKAFNICKILLLLNNCNGIYGVSKIYKDKASRPVLDIEEVTISLSINAKGLKILFSKDLYIYLVKKD